MFDDYEYQKQQNFIDHKKPAIDSTK